MESHHGQQKPSAAAVEMDFISTDVMEFGDVVRSRDELLIQMFLRIE
jgi:hypothetical protein